MSQGPSFSAQVSDFVRQTEGRIDAVFKESCQRVISEMQTPVAEGGNMPVDTGFLRASIQVNKSGLMPLTGVNPADGTLFSYSSVAASLVILGLQTGETLFVSYTANYARHQHYGSNGRPGRQWITMAAQRWPLVVNQICVELQKRVAGT